MLAEVLAVEAAIEVMEFTADAVLCSPSYLISKECVMSEGDGEEFPTSEEEDAEELKSFFVSLFLS